jgi:hypothetical protein
MFTTLNFAITSTTQTENRVKVFLLKMIEKNLEKSKSRKNEIEGFWVAEVIARFEGVDVFFSKITELRPLEV